MRDIVITNPDHQFFGCTGTDIQARHPTPDSCADPEWLKDVPRIVELSNGMKIIIKSSEIMSINEIQKL